ncbi:hypothetical protein D3C71_2107410 [compost metagenome]
MNTRISSDGFKNTRTCSAGLIMGYGRKPRTAMSRVGHARINMNQSPTPMVKACQRLPAMVPIHTATPRKTNTRISEAK